MNVQGIDNLVKMLKKKKRAAINMLEKFRKMQRRTLSC